MLFKLVYEQIDISCSIVRFSDIQNGGCFCKVSLFRATIDNFALSVVLLAILESATDTREVVSVYIETSDWLAPARSQRATTNDAIIISDDIVKSC